MAIEYRIPQPETEGTGFDPIRICLEYSGGYKETSSILADQKRPRI
jgi:hypothetical protein